MKLVVAAGAALAIAACAMGGAKQATAPQSAAPAADGVQTMPHPDDPRQQIEQLAAQIDQDRIKIGLPDNAHSMSAPVAPIAPEHDLACTAPAGSKCGQSCTLSTTICSNADQICKLADKLEGDEWAKQKCGDARQTCGDAKKQCCDCTP